jgi:hypothetical protein
MASLDLLQGFKNVARVDDKIRLQERRESVEAGEEQVFDLADEEDADLPGNDPT